jgi:hypothetical protein
MSSHAATASRTQLRRKKGIAKRATSKTKGNVIVNGQELSNPIIGTMLYGRVTSLKQNGNDFDGYVGHSLKSLEYYMQKETDWDEPVVDSVVIAIMEKKVTQCQYVAQAVNLLQLQDWKTQKNFTFDNYTTAYAMVKENNIWGTVIFRRFQKPEVPTLVTKHVEAECESVISVYGIATSSNFQEYIKHFILKTTHWGETVSFIRERATRSNPVKLQRKRSHWIVEYHKIPYSRDDGKACVPMTLLQMEHNVTSGGHSKKLLYDSECRKSCLNLALKNNLSYERANNNDTESTYTAKLKIAQSLKRHVMNGLHFWEHTKVDCTLCKSTLNWEEPTVTIPDCLHTFCAACYSNYLISTDTKNFAKGKATCINCRTPYTDVVVMDGDKVLNYEIPWDNSDKNNTLELRKAVGRDIQTKHVCINVASDNSVVGPQTPNTADTPHQNHTETSIIPGNNSVIVMESQESAASSFPAKPTESDSSVILMDSQESGQMVEHNPNASSSFPVETIDDAHSSTSNMDVTTKCDNITSVQRRTKKKLEKIREEQSSNNDGSLHHRRKPTNNILAMNQNDSLDDDLDNCSRRLRVKGTGRSRLEDKLDDDLDNCSRRQRVKGTGHSLVEDELDDDNDNGSRRQHVKGTGRSRVEDKLDDDHDNDLDNCSDRQRLKGTGRSRVEDELDDDHDNGSHRQPIKGSGNSHRDNYSRPQEFKDIIDLIEETSFKECTYVRSMHASWDSQICIFKYGVMTFGCENTSYSNAQMMAHHALFHLARIFKPPVSAALECPFRCGAVLDTRPELECHMASKCRTKKWWKQHHPTTPMVYLIGEPVLSCFIRTSVTTKLDLLDTSSDPYPCGLRAKHPFEGASQELSSEKRALEKNGLIEMRAFKQKCLLNAKVKECLRRPKQLKYSLPHILLMPFLKPYDDEAWEQAISDCTEVETNNQFSALNKKYMTTVQSLYKRNPLPRQVETKVKKPMRDRNPQRHTYNTFVLNSVNEDDEEDGERLLHKEHHRPSDDTSVELFSNGDDEEEGKQSDDESKKKTSNDDEEMDFNESDDSIIDDRNRKQKSGLPMVVKKRQIHHFHIEKKNRKRYKK